MAPFCEVACQVVLPQHIEQYSLRRRDDAPHCSAQDGTAVGPARGEGKWRVAGRDACPRGAVNAAGQAILTAREAAQACPGGQRAAAGGRRRWRAHRNSRCSPKKVLRYTIIASVQDGNGGCCQGTVSSQSARQRGVGGLGSARYAWGRRLQQRRGRHPFRGGRDSCENYLRGCYISPSFESRGKCGVVGSTLRRVMRGSDVPPRNPEGASRGRVERIRGKAGRETQQSGQCSLPHTHSQVTAG